MPKLNGSHLTQICKQVSPRLVSTDLGLQTYHVIEKHLLSEDALCCRIIEELVQNGKPDFISSSFYERNEKKLKSLLSDGLALFANQNAEEIGQWYDGCVVPSNMEKDVKNVYVSTVKMSQALGQTSQFIKNQGVFCIKDTDILRIAMRKTNDSLYNNGVYCSSAYPSKTEEKALKHYIRLEDIINKQNFSDIDKLYFILRNKYPQEDIVKSEDYYTRKPILSVYKKISQQSKIIIDYNSDDIKPHVKYRNFTTGEKFKEINPNTEDFQKRFPRSYELISDMTKIWSCIKSNNIEQIYPNRNNEVIDKVNSQYNTAKGIVGYIDTDKNVVHSKPSMTL